MSNLTLHREPGQPVTLIRPEPKTPVVIRAATERGGGGDLAFIDALMKKHNKMVGFASMKELKSHIEQGTALIAECHSRAGGNPADGTAISGELDARLRGHDGRPTPIGYCLYRDCYMKHEDCGYVSQLNVAPHRHRGLVGAALVKAMFERVNWGVRLFSCWCAQDLEANRFWEAMGFVPLAFRSGSRGKAQGGNRKKTRMHIFWQRRVREGDDYPFWYPSQTNGGRMGEARLVFPIPADRHWSDELPMVLPGVDLNAPMNDQSNAGALPEGGPVKAKRERKQKTGPPVPVPPAPKNSFGKGGLRFAPPTPPTPAPGAPSAVEAKPKPKRPPRVKQKNDPRHLIVAREVRDRFLEEINTGRLLPSGCDERGAVAQKYDVSRQLAAASELQSVPLLRAA